MEILKKIVEFFDGNKTLIGMFLLWLVEKTWFVDFAGVAVVDIVSYLGMILAGVGITHKGVKTVQSIKAPKKEAVE